jgi:hypothetical protein
VHARGDPATARSTDGRVVVLVIEVVGDGVALAVALADGASPTPCATG